MRFFLLLIGIVFGLEVSVRSPSAILMNADTGKILYAKREKEPLYPASTTKIATALYILSKNVDLDEKVEIKKELIRICTKEEKNRLGLPSYVLEPDGSHFFLKAKERISMRDLLYGLLICSGNDAAVVLADRVDGNVLQFVEDLNAYLRSIGCSSTHFCNPHGLHHPDHVTTCLDLAKMTKAAMAYPLFQKIVSTKSYVRPKTNLQETKTLVSFNRLLKKGKYFYPFAIGVKTGYHSAAKYTLVAAARKEGRTLIAVLLGSEESKERYLDAKELFEKAFLEKKKKKLLVDKERLFSIKADSDITARVERELCYEYYPSEEEEVSVKAHWEDLSLPIQKGKVIGKMTLETGGVLLESVPLIAEKDVKPSLFYPLKRLLKKMINS